MTFGYFWGFAAIGFLTFDGQNPAAVAFDRLHTPPGNESMSHQTGKRKSIDSKGRGFRSQEGKFLLQVTRGFVFQHNSRLLAEKRPSKTTLAARLRRFYYTSGELKPKLLDSPLVLFTWQSEKKRTKKKVDIPFFRATVDMLKSQIPKFPVTAPKTGIWPPRLGSPDSMGHLRSFSRNQKNAAMNGGFLYIYIYNWVSECVITVYTADQMKIYTYDII